MNKNGVLKTYSTIYTKIDKDNFIEAYNKVMNGEIVCVSDKYNEKEEFATAMFAVSAGWLNTSGSEPRTITFADTLRGNEDRYGEPYFITYSYFDNYGSPSVQKDVYTYIDLYMKYACPVGTLSFYKIGGGDKTYSDIYEWEDITWNIGGTNYHVYKRTK